MIYCSSSMFDYSVKATVSYFKKIRCVRHIFISKFHCNFIFLVNFGVCNGNLLKFQNIVLIAKTTYLIIMANDDGMPKKLITNESVCCFILCCKTQQDVQAETAAGILENM